MCLAANQIGRSSMWISQKTKHWSSATTFESNASRCPRNCNICTPACKCNTKYLTELQICKFFPGHHPEHPHHNQFSKVHFQYGSYREYNPGPPHPSATVQTNGPPRSSKIKKNVSMPYQVHRFLKLYVPHAPNVVVKVSDIDINLLDMTNLLLIQVP